MDGYKWHTPTLSAGSGVIRTMTVPAEMLSYVGWAIGELTNSYKWLEVGSPVADVVTAAQAMLDSWYEQELIGALMPFVGNVPAGWLVLDGSQYDSADYPELATVVPAAWLIAGGDTIQLPDMTAAAVVGSGTGYAAGDTGGETEHTLSAAEMPSHSHTYIQPIANVDVEPPAGVPDVAAGVGAGADTSSAGSGDAHNNMPPYLVAYWAIFAGRE